MKKPIYYFFFLFTLLLYLSFCTQPDAALKESMKKGKVLYEIHCLTCHMENGEGIPNLFPPVAKADYMLADRTRAIKETIFGVEGEMVINGVTYDGSMPAQLLSDQETADVLNYIFNSWGTEASPFTSEEIRNVRESGN
ncbi:MAG: cytochrome c [Bacteroidota bacterium]